MATWSKLVGLNEQAVKTLQQVYGPQVSYYGKLLSRQAALADKRIHRVLAPTEVRDRSPNPRHVVRRWPHLHRDRPCRLDGDQPSNRGTGLRHRTSRKSRAVLAPSLLPEAGKVLDRETQPTGARSDQGWWIVLVLSTSTRHQRWSNKECARLTTPPPLVALHRGRHYHHRRLVSRDLPQIRDFRSKFGLSSCNCRN
jgi:hypothetical protein